MPGTVIRDNLAPKLLIKDKAPKIHAQRGTGTATDRFVRFYYWETLPKYAARTGGYFARNHAQRYLYRAARPAVLMVSVENWSAFLAAALSRHELHGTVLV